MRALETLRAKQVCSRRQSEQTKTKRRPAWEKTPRKKKKQTPCTIFRNQYPAKRPGLSDFRRPELASEVANDARTCMVMHHWAVFVCQKRRAEEKCFATGELKNCRVIGDFLHMHTCRRTRETRCKGQGLGVFVLIEIVSTALTG